MSPVTFEEQSRIREAYFEMARRANYRPAASSDGLGGILLSDQELKDPERLSREATEYARHFIEEEESIRFWVGIANYRTNKALVYAIETARLLCSDELGITHARRLSELLLKEVEQAEREIRQPETISECASRGRNENQNM